MFSVSIIAGAPVAKLGAYECLRAELIESRVICADFGAELARSLSIDPVAIVGDLDSISRDTLDYFRMRGTSILEFPKDKAQTDLELALLHARAMRPQSVTILGALGGRIDHFLANICLCARPDFDDLPITLIEPQLCGYILREGVSKTLTGNRGAVFSLIPLLSGTTVSIVGARWDLNNAHIPFGSTAAVSNEFLDGPMTCTVHSGRALLLVLD